MTCGYAVDWVRRCYASKWRLYQGRRDIEVTGRYYLVPKGTPTYPGWHLVGSRNWTDGQWAIDSDLGEVRGADQTFKGNIPAPFTLEAIRVGSSLCIADGEINLPPDRYHFGPDVFADTGVEILTEELFPNVIFAYAVPSRCLPILGDPNTRVLATPEIILLAKCPMCNALLADPYTNVLGDPDHVIEGSCIT